MLDTLATTFSRCITPVCEKNNVTIEELSLPKLEPTNCDSKPVINHKKTTNSCELRIRAEGEKIDEEEAKTLQAAII